MIGKTERYWAEVQSMADEVGRLSTEVQGPLIDEHLDFIDVQDMSIEEICDYIAQFYDEDTTERWAAVERQGQKIVDETGVSVDDLSHDLWTLVYAASHPTESKVAH